MYAMYGVILGIAAYFVTRMHSVNKYFGITAVILSYMTLFTTNVPAALTQYQQQEEVTDPKKHTMRVMRIARILACISATSVWLFLKYCHMTSGNGGLLITCDVGCGPHLELYAGYNTLNATTTSPIGSRYIFE